MKLSIVTLFLGLFISLTSLADEQNHGINVQALNSPVKLNSTALFSLDLPEGFNPGKVEYEIKSQDQKHKSKESSVQLENQNGKWVAQVSTEKLQPGNFKIEFEVKADKSWMDSIKNYVKNKLQKNEVHPNEGNYKGETQFNIVKGPILPPDPGEAGKATLEGIDSNNNGVRDDVEIWIYQNYGDSEKTTAALMQKAQADQLQLVVAFVDKNKSIEVTHQIFKAMRCMWYLVGVDQETVLRNKMKAIEINTDTRIRADIRANANFSGQTGTVPNPQKADCDFDPDTMLN